MKIENLNKSELTKTNGGGGIIEWIWGKIGDAAAYHHNTKFAYGQAMSGGTCCEE